LNRRLVDEMEDVCPKLKTIAIELKYFLVVEVRAGHYTKLKEGHRCEG